MPRPALIFRFRVTSQQWVQPDAIVRGEEVKPGGVVEGSVRFCAHAQSASTFCFCPHAAPAAAARTGTPYVLRHRFAKVSNVVFMRNIGLGNDHLPGATLSIIDRNSLIIRCVFPDGCSLFPALST